MAPRAFPQQPVEALERLLNYIKPDVVHVMVDGKIVKTGGPEVALELEEEGYADYREFESA